MFSGSCDEHTMMFTKELPRFHLARHASNAEPCQLLNIHIPTQCYNRGEHLSCGEPSSILHKHLFALTLDFSPSNPANSPPHLTSVSPQTYLQTQPSPHQPPPKMTHPLKKKKPSFPNPSAAPLASPPLQKVAKIPG